MRLFSWLIQYFITAFWVNIALTHYVYMHLLETPMLTPYWMQKNLTEALSRPVESLFEVGDEDTWASIRRLLKRETEAAVLKFSTAIAGFEMDQAAVDTMVQNLRSYARNVVVKKAREEAGKVLIHMKDR